MCRLLGIYGKINIWQKILIEFQEQAKTGKLPSIPNLLPGHKDGWGMACSNTDNSGMVLIGKYEGSAIESPHYKEHVNSYLIQPKIFICHLRRASPAIQLSLPNCHPFLCKNWAFIHNGTVYDASKLVHDPELEQTSDDSDSEYLFHYLLTGVLSKNTIIENLIQSLTNISVDFSSVNSILSNGKEFFAIRYCKKHKDYYTLFYCETDFGIIISSEPMLLPELQESKWQEMPNRSLLWVSDDPPKVSLTVF